MGWADIVPGWAHAIAHVGTLGMGVLPAIWLYERFGFVREGIKRGAMRFEGIDYDCVMMGLLARPGRGSVGQPGTD